MPKCGEEGEVNSAWSIGESQGGIKINETGGGAAWHPGWAGGSRAAVAREEMPPRDECRPIRVTGSPSLPRLRRAFGEPRRPPPRNERRCTRRFGGAAGVAC